MSSVDLDALALDVCDDVSATRETIDVLRDALFENNLLKDDDASLLESVPFDLWLGLLTLPRDVNFSGRLIRTAAYAWARSRLKCGVVTIGLHEEHPQVPLDIRENRVGVCIPVAGAALESTETKYDGYKRLQIRRDDFSEIAGSVDLVRRLDFPAANDQSQAHQIRAFAIGVDGLGIISCGLRERLSIYGGITPSFAPRSIQLENLNWHSSVAVSPPRPPRSLGVIPGSMISDAPSAPE